MQHHSQPISHRRTLRRFGVTTLVAALVVAIPGTQALGQSSSTSGVSDDLFLLTTSVAPNVLVVLDNSGSMDHLEWHENYDPADAGTFDCTAFAEGATYWGWQFGSTFSICGRTRNMYKPRGDDTRYDGSYMNWYFSSSSDAVYGEIQTANAATAGCPNGATNYDHKYRRSRFDAARQVLLDLACIAEPKGVRIGIAQFRAPGAPNDPNGGYVAVGIEETNAAHMNTLEAFLSSVVPNSWTPLGETLFQTYTYFMSRNAGDVPLGVDGSTRFPVYDYNLTGAEATSGVPADPVEYACQRNFIVVITDGESTRDNFDSDPADTAAGFDDFDDLIGDYVNDGEVEDPWFCCEGAAYLDDIAAFMKDTDFRPDFAGDQTIDTYTVGFTTSPLANDLLERTASEGNGEFYFTETGDQLAEALLNALNDIIEKSQSFTAATVPSARTADGGSFYQSYFFPLASTAFWEGHLRAWKIEANGDVTDKNGNCALNDEDAGECNSGTFKAGAQYFWDAHDEVPAPASRNLYTSRTSGFGSLRVNFDAATMSASDLGVSTFAAPPDQSPNDARYGLLGSTAVNEEGLADEIVEYARGCEFGSGVQTSDVAAGRACNARVSRLGDFFHSSPAVVGRPRSSTGGAAAFQYFQAYQDRSRMIYVGANDGFLHAFEAGNWNTGVTPPSYTQGTGVEKFGFAPWEPRQNLRFKAIDDPLGRHYYVDGSPQVADVWLQSANNDPSQSVDEWHTILVGGLRQGGRHYYALDVSNPDGKSGPAPYGRPFPDYMWEFPREDDPNNTAISTSYLPYMGETWGEPIITRIKVKDTATPGLTHERWVVIVTGGYSRTGNPNDPDYDLASTAGRSLYVIDAKSGDVLAEKRMNVSASDDRQHMLYAFAATPSVFDLDNDGYSDVIYAADLGGQIFKWVIKPAADLGNTAQPDWSFRRFFAAPSGVVSGGDTRYKNLFFSPSAALVESKLWLAFGTGERDQVAYPGDTTTTSENNWFVSVRDDDPYDLGGSLTTITELDLTDVTGNSGAATITNQGFAFMLADGEKVVTNTEIFSGTVITATFTPDTSGTDPCTMKGTGTLYAFNLVSGEGYFEDSPGVPSRGLDIGAGLPTDPRTSVGKGGKQNRVYIEKSDTKLLSIEADDLNLGGNGLYWREK